MIVIILVGSFFSLWSVCCVLDPFGDCHKFVISIGEQMNFYAPYFWLFYCGTFILLKFFFSSISSLNAIVVCNEAATSGFSFNVVVVRDVTVDRNVRRMLEIKYSIDGKMGISIQMQLYRRPGPVVMTNPLYS